MDRFYIGASANVAKRHIKHLSNHSGFTSKSKDWIIVYVRAFKTKSAALLFESKIKSWKSRVKIQEIVFYV